MTQAEPMPGTAEPVHAEFAVCANCTSPIGRVGGGDWVHRIGGKRDCADLTRRLSEIRANRESGDK